MPGPSDLTLSLGGHKRETADRPMPQPTLFVALECDRPAAGSSRHALGGVSAVLLGRGRTRQHERSSGAAGEELVVRVPDPWMSSQHARLESSFGRWILSDAGSKNGTLVNGAAIDRAVLHDGDLVELGHTLFWFRERVPLGHEDPRDLEVDLAAAAARPPGTVTLAPAYRRVLDDLERMARSAIGILLLGESGTGKELLARAIHRLSGRSGDLVAVNCGAIPDTLVESELFGHKKGAFSGASEDRVGLVRSAHGGTLFLDEVGDLPLGSQAALLRVLQEKEVLPVGASRPLPVDIRVVAATHRDLDDMVEGGEFRQDLFARLAGFTAELPPLRDRREDLGLLFATLLGRHLGEIGEHPPVGPASVPPSADLIASHAGIDPVAARALYRYGWPRNVRELDSALATGLVLAAGKTLALEHLPGEIRAALDARPAQPPPAPVSPPAASGGGEIGLSAEDRALRDELVGQLRHHAGNISAVSRAMGKDRKQIQRWVKRFGLAPESFR